MADMHEGELELELEDEFGEGEEESGLEGEGWLGAIGNIASSLLGEGEGEEEFEEELEGEEEFEEELEGELEEESGEGEGWLGAIGNIASSLLGEGEDEGEVEGEGEGEGEQEMVHEIAGHGLTHNEAVAEMMADAAAREAHEGEAEALVGAAAVTVISPKDRRALRNILPHLVKLVALLTRILRRRRRTRRAVRALPTIVRRAVKDLKRQAAKGVPITRKRAIRATAKQARRVLKSPKACATAIRRNLKVSRAYQGTRGGTRSRRFQRRRRVMR